MAVQKLFSKEATTISIRTFIVDDEAPARRELRFLLEKLPECQIVGEAASGEEAIEALSNLEVDVLFLDIHLHDTDGISVARTLLAKGRLPLVVFATAYDSYALKAFEVHALDYILKPFDPQRLETTWNQVLERRHKGTDLDHKLDEIRALLQDKDHRLAPATNDHFQGAEPSSTHKPARRVAANKNGKLLLVDVSKIRYATVEGRKAMVKVEGELLELNLSLLELEERLDPSQFCRTHRAYLVNISAIREIIPWFNGAYNLILDDKSEVPVSRNYAKHLKDLLGL